MSRADDIKMFESFEKALQEYKRIRGDILGASGQVDQARIEADQDRAAARFLFRARTIAQIVAANKAQADLSSTSIGKAVDTAEYGMLISLAMAIVAAIICGYLLLRAIVDPMRDIVRTLELTGSGDLSRLRLARKDEFNAIETGFNGMVDELTGLVGKTSARPCRSPPRSPKSRPLPNSSRPPRPKWRPPPPRLAPPRARFPPLRASWCAP